jgi:hypothetical protein
MKTSNKRFIFIMASVVLFALFLEAACYLALRLPVLQDVASRNWLKYYRDSGLY